MQPMLNDLVMTLRVLYKLPAYLRNPLDLAECRAMVRRRLERREGDFLDLVRSAIFCHPEIGLEAPSFTSRISSHPGMTPDHL